MARKTLSIIVYGPGTDAKTRSHWALAIHDAGANMGTILQVLVIDNDRLIYHFDMRKDGDLHELSSEGLFRVAELAEDDTPRVRTIISEEPAPRDGKERCQDWVRNAIIALEAEELVPPGTSEEIDALVGQPAESVARQVGSRWQATSL